MSPDGVYQAGVEYRTRALRAGPPMLFARSSDAGAAGGARLSSGFRVAGSGIGAGGTIAAEVIEVRSEDDASLRLGAARLRAELNGLTPGELPPTAADEPGLLLAYLRDRARSGLLDPVLIVPALTEPPRGEPTLTGPTPGEPTPTLTERTPGEPTAGPGEGAR